MAGGYDLVRVVSILDIALGVALISLTILTLWMAKDA
jgi:hypothetical protein